MPNKPKISIIVPVYNVEKYIRRCLDSIKEQTFTDWECICVDDGSPDNSGRICDEYAKKDSRFVVIHKKNGGVSSARNSGLNVAKGEWISFIDSDDWIEKETYESVIKVAENNCVDLVQFGIVIEKDEKIILEKSYKDGFVGDLSESFEPSAWHKLFLRKIIYANNIRFPEGITLSEDRYFSFMCYLNASKIYSLNKCFYHYRCYSESSTHKMSEKNIQDEINAITLMENALSCSNKKSDFEKVLINQKIEAKNHALFLLEKPNFFLWRKLYSEVDEFLEKSKGKKKVLYVLLKLHLDFLVKFLIKIFVK